MNTHLKWIFALSLVANVFLTGFIMGRTVPSPFPNKHKEMEHHADFSQLSEEKRTLVEQGMERIHGLRKQNFEQMEKNRNILVEILEAETFDDAKFIKASSALENAFSAEKQQITKEVVALAKQLTAEERRVLAEHFKHPFRHGHPRGEHDQEHDKKRH